MADDPPYQSFEYRVVPAPRRGEKAKGVRSGEGRFALAMSRLFNRMGELGWEYVRADTLPAEERVGFTGTEVRYHALLVFRRTIAPEPAVIHVQMPAELVASAPSLLGMADPAEWAGFEEQDVSDDNVVSLLAARAQVATA